MDRVQDPAKQLDSQAKSSLPPMFHHSQRWIDDEGATEHENGSLQLSEGQSLTFVKHKSRFQKDHFHPEKPAKLRNSLLIAVGFLELANAGDFAANVWNMSPLPVYAVVLMAMGGTVALAMLYFVVKDSRLSWRNICGLRQERLYLLSQRDLAREQDRADMIRSLDCFLHVNFRELGTEYIDRIGMDILMGFGALVVGVGTYMAIGGDDRAVFLASNLLTGYIGNTPCAVYGLVNLGWSVYVWVRARRHKAVTAPGVQSTRFEQMLKSRTANVQLHSYVNGITGIVAGAASLATATQWWAYVVLIPCILTSGMLNWFWRNRVGYDRPFIRGEIYVDEDSLVNALRYADLCRQRVENSSSEPVFALLPELASFPSVLAVIMNNNLFEDFCLRILADQDLTARLFPEANDSVTIDAQRLSVVEDRVLLSQLLDVAKTVVNKAAPKCFVYKERWLLEALGCYMTALRVQEKSKEEDQMQAVPGEEYYPLKQESKWVFWK